MLRKSSSRALLKTQACPEEPGFMSLARSNRKQQSTSRRGKNMGRGPFCDTGTAKS